MRNAKKILLGLTVVLTLVCVLALAVCATEYKIPVRDGWEAAGGPMGAIHDDTANGWVDSGYSDIDDHVSFTNGDKDVWVQIATNTLADIKTDKYPELSYGKGFRAYFNEYEKKIVVIATSEDLHSQLSAYKSQTSTDSLTATAKKYALYDKLYNIFVMEYIFTQDAFKDVKVPGLDMTWAEYMSSKIKTSDIYSVAFPSGVTDANADTRTNDAIIVMERAVANALYTLYSTNETYAAAFAEAGNPSTLTGSTYAPKSDKQRMSRALLTGLVIWAQENGVDAGTVSALSTAAKAYSDEIVLTYYFAKGSGGSFGWSDGLENNFGTGGYMTMVFLVNSNTSENANVGCLGKYVKTLEIRNTQGSTSIRRLRNFGSVLIGFDYTETVLFDKSISSIYSEGSTSEDRALFRYMDSLTTVAHVSFGANGKYTDDVKYGAVDFSGFTATANSGNIYIGHLARNSTAITDAVWFRTLTLSGVDYSGVIQNYALFEATGLKTFTVPANNAAPLTEIRANAFRGSGLKEMYVLRPVADSLVISDTAFYGCGSITMYVLDKTSATNVYAALNKAGVKNVAVEIFNPLQNPVASTGVLVKMKDFISASSDKLAIRFQFLWEEKGAAAAANEAANYTFKGLGVIASTADTYDSYEETVLSETGLASSSLVAQEMLSASAGENSKVVNVLVTNADFTDGRRVFLNGYDAETGYYPFCLSLYGMTGDQITSEYYVAAYTEWEDADGNTFYTFTTLDYTKDGEAKNSISLYDTTLGLVKRGQINGSDYESEEDAQKYFYSVLELGALTTSSFTNHATGANKGYTDLLNTDGSFTYWNVDYRKYVLDSNFTGGSLSAGWGYKPDTTEAVSTSGVQWSILRDGAKYVVLITKNKNEAPEGVTYDYKVPTVGRNSQYSYYQPFHYLYGDVSKAATNAKTNGSMTVYSPAVTQAVFNAITTIVVDDGIVALDSDSLSYVTSATTYVLPETCTTVGAYAISKNGKLTDIIWTGDPDAKSETKYNVDHLYDLRGVSTVSAGSFLCDNYAAVNVVTQKGINVDGQLAFNNANALVRYWAASGYSGYTMPAAGTIDVSRGWNNNINKGYFNAGTNITTIIVKATLKSSHNAFTSGEDDRSYRAYGAGRSYNFILVDDNGNQVDYTGTNFITSLEKYITDLHAGAKAAQAANCDNLSVNGDSVKTIFPDLFS